MAIKILKFLDDKDISQRLSDEELHEIAENCALGYSVDKKSRQSWEDQMEEALKFAKQVSDPKSFPWEGCSNIIFPLISIACNIFAARAADEILQDKLIVKVGTNGADPEGKKKAKAMRVAEHMSYQRLVESDTWEPDLDKLLHILPLVGVCYRKVYYDPIKKIPQSDFCNPKDIIVNHNVASLAQAERITHRFFCTKNDVISKIRAGYYNKNFDVDQLEPAVSYTDRMVTDPDDNFSDNSTSDLQSGLYEFHEQHNYLDLDDDGYMEPYIVVYHKGTSQVAAIWPRYDIDSIRTNDKEEIEYIEPDQYFIDSHFLPSPDGGFHSLGYGQLLYPLNKAVNTLGNQLIDSGTLANTQSGIIGRQLKIKGGNLKTQMGELIPVDAGSTGRVQDNIFLFPFKEPSPTLFQLLGLLIEFCKDVASINDVLTGKAQPQNSPASSVFELSSNGLKMYSDIAKRLYRSLKKEFKALYKLNGKYLDPQSYLDYHDSQEASIEDYRDVKIDISPVANPNMATDLQRLANSQAISFLSQNPALLQKINLGALVTEFFEALRLPADKIQKLILPDSPPPPDPNMVKAQTQQQKVAQDGQIAEKKLAIDEKRAKIEEAKVLIKSHEADAKVHRTNADATLKLAESASKEEQQDRALDIQEAQVRNAEKKLQLDNKKINADVHKTGVKAEADIRKAHISANKPKSGK